MSRITILDNDHITIWYHPETKIVHHEFHKFVHGEQLREGLNTGLTLINRYASRKWLSDDRQYSTMIPEDVDWYLTNFFPRALKTKWKYWAIVMPGKVIDQLNIKRAISGYSKRGMIVKTFNNPEAAMIWLESQK